MPKRLRSRLPPTSSCAASVRAVRVLVTGASGFVGRHLVEACEHAGDEVVGLARGPAPDGERAWIAADLRDGAAAARALREARPERVYHLAAAASVAKSWEDPPATVEANLLATVNLLEAAAVEAPGARVLFAGSSEGYGPVPRERQPVTEDEPLRPQNPYAASKAACDVLAGFYGDGRGLDVVRTRAFNHAGPGQSDTYVVASFARQIAEAEAAGLAELELLTGDLRPRRDFTDVRDVVRAYRLALERAPAGVYNVCRGTSAAVGDILAGLARHTRLAVEQRTDSTRLRKQEVMEIRGSHDRLTEATGWQPEIELDTTLADTLGWWRERVAGRVATMSRRALITGITGQDGSYLADLLLEKDYEVHGMVRRSSTEPSERRAAVRDEVVAPHRRPARRALAHARARRLPSPTRSTTWPARRSSRRRGATRCAPPSPPAAAVARLLEAVRRVVPEARFYQASSSEIFGLAGSAPQNEDTPVRPRTPYGAAKAYGHFLTVTYRESLRPFRQLGDPLQPRVAAARTRVRDAQGHARRGRDQARPRHASSPSATSTPSATGATRATTSRPCG